jgi:hypothetical protein
MSSIKSFYAQRDNRVLDVKLTGYITDNGAISGSVDINHAAVASLNTNYSQLFLFDTRDLSLRSGGVWYLVGIVFPNVSPPRFYPGFEINIVINVKDTNVPSPKPLVIRIQKNPSIPLNYGDATTFIEVNNIDYANTTDTNVVYSYGNRTLTLLSTGTTWVVKSSYLNNGPSSIFM